MSAAASPAERAAVDALLGPPPIADGADGPGRSERGRPQQAREERRLLLPALHAVQDAIGWISAGALGYVCERLRVPPAEAYGVACESYALLSTPGASVARGAHMRRHRLPQRGRGRARRGGRARPRRRRGRDVGAEPLPRRLRARAGAALLQIAAGEDSVLAPAGAPRRARGAARRDRRRCERRRRRGRLGPADRRTSPRTGCDCCAGWASWTPRASRTTARTAATRRCESRWSAGRRR